MAALSPKRAALLIAAFALGCAGTRKPLEPQDGRTLVTCPGPAVQVFAVGAFNGWKAPGAPLARQPDGRYSARIALPPGLAVVACERHAADGTVALEVPLNADRVVDDGFGGRNGLYEVVDDPPLGVARW